MSNEEVVYGERKTRGERIVIAVKFTVYALLFYFNFVKPHVFDTFPWMGTVNDALLFLIGASLLVSFIRLIVITIYVRKNGLKSNIKDNFILGINRIVSVLNTIFIVVTLMMIFGIDIVKFLTSITIVAAAIALTFKDYITNMISGLIIMFSDQLSLGDHIIIAEQKGKIRDITLINLVLQNDDDDMVLIPHSVVFSSLIINQSKQNIKKLTIEFELDLKYHLSPEYLEQRLKGSVARFADNITENTFSLKTVEIKKDMAKFKVQFLMRNYDKLTERSIRRTLNTEILTFSDQQHN